MTADSTAITARYPLPRGSIDPARDRSWLRRAMPLLSAHKTPLISALALTLLGLVVQVQMPNLLNQALTRSLALHRTPLSHYVEWVLGLALIAGAASYLARLMMMRTAYGIEYDLRNLLYEHLTRMSFDFYDRSQSGQLISRANSDIRSMQMYLTFAPFILVQCAIAPVAFGFMLSINVPLALIAMVTVPFVFMSGTQMRRAMFPASWLIQSRLAEVATIVDENINGARVVKAFAAEENQLRALARAAGRLRWAYIVDADLRARYAPVVQNLPQVGIVAVLLYGGHLVLHHQLGVGAILAFSAYIVMLQAPFQMLGMLMMMGQRAAASAVRVFEVLDERPSVADAPDAVDLVDARGAIGFDNVDFSYSADRAAVLSGCTFTIRPGETVALVGRTGSGKSTIARLLTRFYDVTGGAVRVDDLDVRGVTLTSLRDLVGVVTEDPFLFSVSIRDNISYGCPTATLADIEAAAVAASADEFIRALPRGYDTVVGERGYTLSGGQRQRIALARALLVNPRVLVLDDATSAVDVHVETLIHEHLRRLMADRTTLLIAHRLSTISLADRVLLLEDGHIVDDGTHDELLARSAVYAEILTQFEVPEAAV